MKKRVGLQRVLIALSVTILIYGASFFIFKREVEPLDEVVDNLALVIVLLGFCVRIVSRGWKEEGSESGGKLVTTGLYAYIRNPMYLGTFLLGTGVAVAVFHPVALAIFWAGYAAIYIPQIRREERILGGHFGEDYREYCSRVPRLIPRLSQMRDFFGDLFPRKPKWVWRESLSIVGVLLGMMAAETIVDARVFGTEEFWKEPVEFVGAVAVFCLLLFILSKEEK